MPQLCQSRNYLHGARIANKYFLSLDLPFNIYPLMNLNNLQLCLLTEQIFHFFLPDQANICTNTRKTNIVAALPCWSSLPPPHQHGLPSPSSQDHLRWRIIKMEITIVIMKMKIKATKWNWWLAIAVMTMRMTPGEFASTNNHLLGTNQSSHRGGLGPQLGAGGNISAIMIRYDWTNQSLFYSAAPQYGQRIRVTRMQSRQVMILMKMGMMISAVMMLNSKIWLLWYLWHGLGSHIWAIFIRLRRSCWLQWLRRGARVRWRPTWGWWTRTRWTGGLRWLWPRGWEGKTQRDSEGLDGHYLCLPWGSSQAQPSCGGGGVEGVKEEQEEGEATWECHRALPPR